MKILIVDDIEINLELLEAGLEGSGYEIISAKNGIEALEKLKRDSIDMIISDILMPTMDGFQFCRECKKDETLRKIPFVFYAATYTDKKDEEFALSLGADRFVVKPMERKRFMEIIEDVLRNHKKGLLPSTEIPVKKEETVYLKEYNERLINKLEKKMIDLEKEIAEHKRAEEKLRESEEKYRDILNNIDDGYFEVDIAGNLTFFNDSWCKILGYPEDELMGMNNRGYMDEENAKKIYQTFNQVYRTGISTKVLDWKLIRKDGSDCFIETVVSLIKDSNDKGIGFRGIARDITDRKQLEAQLQQAQKMEAIGTLAGGVAHDFNNILTTIIGNASLALMEVGKDDPAREEIEEIKIAGERAAALTRQLLAFSRKQIVQPEILYLNELLTGIEKMLGRLIGEDVELLTIPGPELWQMEADPGQMEQVLMNLVVNARDAMPKGGKLTIETANKDLDKSYFRTHGIKEDQPGTYVMLAVSDTGSGMDKETQNRIFEPFYTTKGIGKGTGLGLSTVYGIVKQSNGFIWVYSEPGQGTTFRVYFPKAKGDVVSEKKEQHPVTELGGTETVLIVEDDDSLRKLAHKALRQHGYKVLEAENGEEALSVSEAHDGSFDLLIIDVVMPKMNGKETAERLQQLYPQMKVIYMSGYTGNAIVHHGVLAPGLNFLEKPFSPDVLSRKVREVLNQD